MKISLITIGVITVVAIGWLLISRTGQKQTIYPSTTTTNPPVARIQPTVQPHEPLSPKSRKDESGSSSPTPAGGFQNKAPDFSLQDYSGKTVALADFAGKPLVINSWAAWCPFCKKELPDFALAQKEFGGKVTIIAIDRGEAPGVAKKYSDELGVTNNLVFLLDPSDSFYQSIGGFSMPETIFVDRNNVIVDHKRGPMDIDEIRQKIQKLIAP